MQMAEKKNREWEDDENHFPRKSHQPDGNPGPGLIAKIVKLSRDKSHCEFRWMRARRNSVYDWNGKKLHAYGDMDIPCKATIPTAALMSVSAYTPGDFHRFFADPRTRMNYLRWAPFMLAAEDWHAAQAGQDLPAPEVDTLDDYED